MLLRRIAFSAAVAAGLAALPLAAAKAQYYPPCSYPLEFPFCVAGAAVNTAAAIATAPFVALGGPPYYGYYQRPYYYHRAYYRPGWRHRHWCAYHPHRCGWR